MRDGGNTRTSVGFGAVDDQFWALVCEDEDWLDREFEEIVSEPAEFPAMLPPRCWCVPTGPVPPSGTSPLTDTGRNGGCTASVIFGVGVGGGNGHRHVPKALVGQRLAREGSGQAQHQRGGGERSPAPLKFS